ncbi:hypothetical protein FKP32DRAFT_1570669 [Trametes sanguinea]|nr:hypothetical protein FKP32DRAFT_1570669 [Trametes sanguinea]
MAAVRRHAKPPTLVCTPRASVDAAHTPTIDSVLKQLKACSRRLQAALSTHRTELQVLERLYYKGKNQHRTALFWQRVAEMRRLGGRVDEMHIDDVVESLRLAFWGEPPTRTTKLLKGPWTHCPDAKALMFVMERCSACCTLVDRARQRLLRAYDSFTLMMQSGAFLQLVLVLAAIASRLSILLTEVRAAAELSWSASLRALRTLYPTEAGKVRPLVKTELHEPTPAAPLAAPSASRSRSPRNTDPGRDRDEVEDEDLGRSLARPPSAVPEQNVDAPFDADATADSRPDELPADPMTFSLSNELAQPIGTCPLCSAGMLSVTNEPSGSEGPLPAQPAMPSAPKRKKADADGGRPVKKKKKKRDEIDDIFGF